MLGPFVKNNIQGDYGGPLIRNNIQGDYGGPSMQNNTQGDYGGPLIQNIQGNYGGPFVKNNIQGDYGGPLIQNNILVGVVSKSLGCTSTSTATTFTQVSSEIIYLNTINMCMYFHGYSQGRTFPQSHEAGTAKDVICVFTILWLA